MRAELLGAAWWVRWLVMALFCVVLVGVFVSLAMPGLAHGLPWPWQVALLSGVALTLGAVMTIATRRDRRAYLAVVGGLRRADRARALNAVRRGEIPADPAVLAAGINLATVFSIPRSTVTYQLLTSGLFVAAATYLAATSIADGDAGRAAAWIVLMSLSVGSMAWVRYRRTRIESNLAALRRAAARVPGVVEATASDEQLASASTTRRMLIWVYGAGTVVLASFTVLAFILARPSPDCRVAGDLINYISDNGDIVAVNPAIRHPARAMSDYQRLVDQLHAYAAAVSSSEVAPRVRRIAELATHAMGVANAAQAAAKTPTDPAQVRRTATYTAIIDQIVDEEYALMDACRLR